MIVQGQAFPTDKHAHIQSLLGFCAAPPVSTIDQTQEQSCTFVLGCLFPFVFGLNHLPLSATIPHSAEQKRVS